MVNSDLTLRAQLTEFRDHKLIRTKRVSEENLCLSCELTSYLTMFEKESRLNCYGYIDKCQENITLGVRNEDKMPYFLQSGY